MIQRQASNLRVPVLRTLFTIPPRYTKLHSLLQKNPVHTALVISGPPQSMEQFRGILDRLQDSRLILRSDYDDILAHPWDELRRAALDVFTDPPTTYGGLMQEELTTFIRASTEGVPPQHSPPPSSEILFEVNPNLVRRFPGQAGESFRVVPILRLRTVTVQTHYRREIESPEQAADVSAGFRTPGGETWYPGVEFTGEGIFVMIDDGDGWQNQPLGTAAESWKSADAAAYPRHVFSRENSTELQPGFVWWHTLSHLLLRSISMYAGYSSASIRERVYFENGTDRFRGGVLLYATQPGSEGTLGGLIALTDSFDRVFSECFTALSSCAGDPLCIGNRFASGRYNGAACYGCLLVSETSCEHRNMWLDRNVLGDNLP